MTTVLFGGAVLASFLAGTVALFAPCCISAMLPAYFASSFATRRALVAMTFVFATGVGLVILPIALGAAAVGTFVNTNHMFVYLAGGLMMVAMGTYMLAGGKLALPMPGMRAGRGRGPLAVLSLGAFSGVASSCCAPVLAGVAALAGASGSLSAAFVLGVAYVFGMVFPLFLIALFWDQFSWGESRLLRGKKLRVRALGRSFAVHTTALASGLILVAMGIFVVVIAFNGNAMPSSGWQVELSARVQHYAHIVRQWAETVPGWVTGAAITAAFAGFAFKALRQTPPLRRVRARPHTSRTRGGTQVPIRHQEEAR
jgi:cytochrome c-type biogenesis protein